MTVKKHLISVTLVLICTQLCCFFAGYGQGNRSATIEGPTQAVQGYKNVYAVVIGISKYQEKDINLKYADKDAELFTTYLEKAYPDKIKHYENLRLLIDSEATKAAVIDNIKWLKQNAKKGDLAIFYFAGHGGVDITDILPSKPGYLLFYDSKPISLSLSGAITIRDLNEALNSISVTNEATTLCILDACHADKSLSPQEVNYAFDNESSPGNLVRFLSCYGNQFAKEYDDLCNGHGVFTYYLVKGLIKDADADGDGKVDIDEIQSYIAKNVRKKTDNQQSPKVYNYDPNFSLSILKDNTGGNFDCLFNGDNTAVHLTQADFIKSKLTEAQAADYERFTNSIISNDFLEPDDYLQVLAQDGVEQGLLDQVKAQWKIKFQNFAQSLITNYLNEANIVNYTEYEKAAKMLDYCIKNSSKNDPGYNALVSKKIWFECCSTNAKLEKGVLKILQNEEHGIRLGLIEKMKQAITIDPNAAYLRNTIGALYRDIGNTKEAEVAYRNAIRLAPRWTYPRINRTYILKNVSEKITEIDTCISINPKMFLAYACAGDLYREKKDYKQSEKYFDIAKKLCLENGENTDDMAYLYQSYGYLFQAENRKDEAESAFKRAIEIYGDQAGSFRQALADFYSTFHEFDKSKSQLDEAIKINPNDALLYVSLGFRSQQMGNNDDAVRWFKKGSLLDSLNSAYYSEIGVLYRNKSINAINDPDKARYLDSASLLINKAYNISPNDVSVLRAEAGLSIVKQDTLSAAKYFKKCLEIDPSDPEVYDDMSIMYFATDIDRGIVLAYKAIALSAPYENEEYYRYIGSLYYYYKQDYTNGLFYFKSALRLDPKNTTLLIGISRIYYLANKIDSANIYSIKAVQNELSTQGIAYPGAIDYFKKKIREDVYDSNFYYFAIGYLLEANKRDFDIGQNLPGANKWYTYAFEMGYYPAFFKLDSIYHRLPGPQQPWFKKNGPNDYESMHVHVNENENEYKIFLYEYAVGDTDQMVVEIARIKDVYGATIKDDITEQIKQEYKYSIDRGFPFVFVLDYDLYRAGRDTLHPDKNNIWYLYERGNDMYEAKKYAEAISFYKNALEMSPENTIILDRLGITCAYNKNYEEALPYFKKALAINDRSKRNVYYNMACALSLQNKTADALAALEGAIKNGYNDFKHIGEDTDLDNIRNSGGFKALLGKYNKQ